MISREFSKKREIPVRVEEMERRDLKSSPPINSITIYTKYESSNTSRIRTISLECTEDYLSFPNE